jgi:hypothetical protein
MRARHSAMAAILWLAAASPVYAACTCIWGGPFIDVQGATDLVVSATVIAANGNSIDLVLDETLRGEEYQDTARVWLDTGELCRAKIGTFPTGTRWVMALERIKEVTAGGFNPHTPNISFGRVGDYSLSRCGGYWLSQAENLVTGNLTGGPRWEMEPKMSPVLLDLVAGYVRGDIDAQTLREAGKVNPELQRMILDTRAFLRRQR